MLNEAEEVRWREALLVALRHSGSGPGTDVWVSDEGRDDQRTTTHVRFSSLSVRGYGSPVVAVLLTPDEVRAALGDDDVIRDYSAALFLRGMRMFDRALRAAQPLGAQQE